MNETELIDDIIQKESDKFTDLSADRGGPTKYGITAKTLGRWRALGRPATREEVKKLSREEAVEIYKQFYIKDPGFVSQRFKYEPLRVHLIDFGVNSGSGAAVFAMQVILKVPADGVFGPMTQKALDQADQKKVHTKLVKARIIRFVHIVEKDVTQLIFLEGWINRALGFLEE